MFWFFAINDFTRDWLGNCIKVMLATRPSWFKPICLSDCRELIQLPGVNVIPWQLSFAPLLAKAGYDVAKASGQFMRMDVPLACVKLGIKDEFVFYTDVDVMFLGECRRLVEIKPKCFAAMRDRYNGDENHFNDGVLLINRQGMLERREELLQFLDQAQGQPDDQQVMNAVYAKHWSDLPGHFNWPPYWGPKDWAEVIHFCGPKPATQRPKEAKREVWEDLQIHGWHFYEKRFRRTLAKASGAVTSCRENGRS